MKSSNRRKRWGIGLSAVVATAIVAVAVPAVAEVTGSQAPLAPLHSSTAGTPVDGNYIVVMKSGKAPSGAVGRARSHGAAVQRQYGTAVRGFAATLSASQLESVRRDSDVAYVEPDQVLRLSATQTGATWGLDRIDQRNRPLNGSYGYTATGAGVTAYVIDTGIRTTHSQFGGRASGGFTSVNDGNGTSDCNGHGTHVAGTIGGSTYGVAKDVRLVAVRVLDCNGSGTTSGVIAGIDWVTANHTSPAVANMSLGGTASSALDSAVSNSIASGVTFAVAAGNSNVNACNTSPARVAAAITVGASTNTDARASYSNYGSCLDVFAPGSSITSAWRTSDSATNTISGTSMASPHVAGVAALYLEDSPSAAPSAVASAITSSATPNVLTGLGTGSPNRLLYSGLTYGSDGGSSGGGAASCDNPTATYTGALTAAGTSQYQPSGGFTATASGTVLGCLTGPASVDLDLYLQKQSSSGTWSTVASSLGSSSTENISYSATAGTYRWRVYSYSGTGSYSLASVQP